VPGPNAAHGRTGRPPRTSRAEILAAARQIIERDGWERLTIRRLAAEIGVGAMTLYHHVRDREDLLVQLINDQADQIPRADLPGEPRDRIIVAATAIHDALAAWPWAAEVLTTDGFLSRVGDSALWMAETIVAGAIDRRVGVPAGQQRPRGRQRIQPRRAHQQGCNLCGEPASLAHPPGALAKR
jgi:AcrR family transcriptional regulator